MHRFLQRPVAVVGSLLTAVVLVGAGISQGHVIWDELSPSSAAPSVRRPSVAAPPVTIPEHLIERDDNARYGLSFDYPVTWLRQGDPSNSDGNEFVSSDDPGVRMRAFGSQRLAEILPETSGMGVDRYERQRLKSLGAHIVEAEPQGLWWRSADHRRREHVDGWRFVYTERPTNHRASITVVEVMADLDGRYGEMQCEAPSSRAASYRSLCNRLVASLVLTDGLDVDPHTPCPTFDCGPVQGAADSATTPETKA